MLELDLADELLLEMKIKKHFEGKKRVLKIPEEDFIEFVRKYTKLLIGVANEKEE